MPLLVLAIAVPLAAQVHQATPLHVLLDRFGIHEHEDMAGMMSMPMPMSEAAVAPPAFAAATAKVFNVTAHQFQFDFSPAPFVVNAGDDVTLNITVPSSDKSPVGHSFFLESYMTEAVPIAKGKTITIHFVATTPGTFTYLCLQSDCGTGHTNMNGVLTVNAAPAGPAITSVSPSSASVTGGTPITILGSGFAANATVSIGPVVATNVKVVDANTITAVTPVVGVSEETGLPFDVVVTNPDGTSATLPRAFNFTVPPLSATQVDPDGAPTAGGVTVTIFGSGFTTAIRTDVTFGGVPATDVHVLSSTQMTVTAPAHAAGTVDVVVTAGSTVTIPKGFTYADAHPKRRSARR